jgi:DNA helicase-2/ATP-dependent DNA helicase PcrA
MTQVFTSKGNPQQREAIATTEGPLLIIAGPGSGKTFTLVERIVYLITQKGVAPENLLVVTFTDKAAQELTTRISNRLLELNISFNLNEVYLGTFHSVCLRLLKEYREFTRLKRNFTLMDQFDQQYFLYRKSNDYRAIANVEEIIGSHQGGAWHKSEKLLKWVNTISEETIDLDQLLNSPEPTLRALGECYQLYHQQLEEANALDFSTIQLETLKLLRNHPKVLAEVRSKIHYMMVDEYQDTNTIQDALLRLLMGDRHNLCVVGDDDQGLYRFRGATIRNILQFDQNFPDGECHQVTLSINYRSHPDIIRFYNRWMRDCDWEHNGQVFRYDKEIKARELNPDEPFPEQPTVVQVSADGEEEDWHKEVLGFLHALRDDGHLTDWNQVAFLFRSVKNDKVVELARFLEAEGIPVYSPRSNQFFDREEIRLAIGALLSLFPQFSLSQFGQVRKWTDDANLPIWDYYDNNCQLFFRNELKKQENQSLLKWTRGLAKEHLSLTEKTTYAFTGLFYQLLQFPLFSCYLDDQILQNGGMQDTRPMRNLAIFSQLLNKFEYLQNISTLDPGYLDKNLRQLFNQFFRFLSDGGLDEYQDDSEYAPSGCVSFLTIHQSKGLEFPVVVVGSLNTTPRKQFSDIDVMLERGGYLTRPLFEPLEETKNYDFYRLYYTAFSRAQNLLALTGKEQRHGRGKIPSWPFEEHFDSVPDWKVIALDEIPLEKVKEVNIKREYSFTSHLTLFENCAEQYRFFKELEFAPIRKAPILFGTLVHQTIEDIHKTVLQGEESQLSKDKIADWFDTNYVYLTKREKVYLSPPVKQLALNHVLNYYDREKHDWTRVKEAEVDVSLVKENYILTGSVDLIRGEGEAVEIVDFKSEKKLDVNHPKDREKLNLYRRQLEVYAHIVEERTGHKVSKMHLYYTGVEGGNPYISFDKDTRLIESTIATFDQVVNRIEQKDFRIKERPPDKTCNGCDARFYCDSKSWSFLE